MTWFRGHPIYAAYLVVIVFSVSMIITAVAGNWLIINLAFISERVFSGEIWRVLTYGLVSVPTVRFAIDMLMIIWFGRDVEKVIGGRSFLIFFGIIYLITPLAYTLVGLLTPTVRAGQSGALAVFVAFAVYYPNATIILNVLAKWGASVLVSIYALMAVSDRDWAALASILATSGFAYACVRYQQGRLTLPSFRLPKRQPKFEVLPGGAQSSKGTSTKSSSAAPRPVRDTTTAEMDALLDKIARSGMGSLTSEERARLDAAAKAHTQRKYGR